MHTLYSVDMGTAQLPASDTQVEHGLDVQNEPSSGNVFSRFASIRAGKPGASWTSFAVGRALDVTGVTGANIAVLSATGINLFAQKIADTGQPLAGSVHRKYAIGAGLVVPVSISGDHQGNYAIKLEAAPISPDGIIAPIIESDSQAVPATPADDTRFTLGAVTLGGVLLPRVRSVEINLGISVTTEGGDSDIFDTEAWIQSIVPTITIKGIDPEWLNAANIPRLGKAGTHANTKLYLRKRLRHGTFVPDGTAEHISITADGLIVVDTPLDANTGSPAETSVTMHCTFDGTNTPLVIDTSAAIV